MVFFIISITIIIAHIIGHNATEIMTESTPFSEDSDPHPFYSGNLVK